MKKAAVDVIVKSRVELHMGAWSGTFLPLSVLANQGFNVHDIERDTPAIDREWHPVLKQTYRVMLKSSSHIQMEMTM